MLRVKQLGISMLEVLVALALMTIAIGGFAVVQIRAVDAASQAMFRAQSIFILSSLAESMRVNVTGQSSYPNAIRSYTAITTSTAAPTQNCLTANCTGSQLATFDAYQAAELARGLGISITMETCPGVSNAATHKRQCLFAAWSNTTLSGTTNGGSANYQNCMSAAGVYVQGSECIMLEAY